MMDVHSKETRSYNMSKIRCKDTKPEAAVRKFLFSRGYRYRKNDPRFPGRPDIVLPKYRTVVFVNGCFWHMHHGCQGFSMPKTNTDFWIAKLKRNKERDKEVFSQLELLGWRVLVIWECEIKGMLFEPRMEMLAEQINNSDFKE